MLVSLAFVVGGCLLTPDTHLYKITKISNHYIYTKELVLEEDGFFIVNNITVFYYDNGSVVHTKPVVCPVIRN